MMTIKTNRAITFLILISFTLTIKINAQNTTNALKYLNQIGEQYDKIRKETWDYTSAVAHSKSARKVDKNRITLLKTIKASIGNVKKMPPFENDESLRDSIAAYFTLTFNVLNNDFAKIVDLEAVAEQSYDFMEAYILAQELANDKLDAASERMSEQYKDFAQRNNITLIEDKSELERKLIQSTEAFKYYNKNYLLFFKAYKQEIYLLDAIQRKDINSIEQNRNALKSISEEGLNKLEEIKDYKGNSSLNLACKRLLTFYIDESETEIPKIADFLILAGEYDKQAKLINSKDRMLVTNEEIENYNKTGEKYNKGVNHFNSTNNSLNTKRNNYLNMWNNSVTNFMSRYIPKK